MIAPREVPAVRTTVTAAELYPAFGAGVEALTGVTPSREAVLALLGQFLFETGGGKSCWCFNLTNIRHTPNDGRSWCAIPFCSEIIAGHERYFARDDETAARLRPAHPNVVANRSACLFRAFDSLEEGCHDHLATLQRRFPRSWAAAMRGDVGGFVLALHDENFYTALPGHYLKQVQWWIAQVDPTLPTV